MFDTKTGQETKDEKGKGKVQTVMDWPFVVGIRRGKG